MKAKASDELRMCVSTAVAVQSAHSALNVLELPESESKLNAINAFLSFGIQQKVPCKRI